MPNWGELEEETVTACAICAVAFSRSVRRHRCKYSSGLSNDHPCRHEVINTLLM